MKSITTVKTKALLSDLIAARHDLLQLAQMHGVEPEDLATWVTRPKVRQTLSGLCALSDFQTQLLLSQYRRFAATRLLRLATGEDQDVTESARKACVDLLRTELRRVAEKGGDEPTDDETSPMDAKVLRKELYGEEPAKE